MSEKKNYQHDDISEIPNREPETVPYPRNCKNPCPYGRGREFCWPCYAEYMKKKR